MNCVCCVVNMLAARSTNDDNAKEFIAENVLNELVAGFTKYVKILDCILAFVDKTIAPVKPACVEMYSLDIDVIVDVNEDVINV